MKYYVSITVEKWSGEVTTEHEYDTEEKGMQVYDRVCKMYRHKGYKPASLDDDEETGLCSIFYKTNKEHHYVRIDTTPYEL